MRNITYKEMLAVIFKREFYLDMVVFIFICIPAVLVILLISLKVDKVLGLLPFIPQPWNVVLFIIFSGSGVLTVWRAYTYLVFIGEGSPCPQLGGTNRLVTCGPYAIVRHPSVIGKLFGIIGLGCLFKATFFTFIVIPTFFAWSVFYNRFIQERGCIEKFGDAYLNYRKIVPMFIPKIKMPKTK